MRESMSKAPGTCIPDRNYSHFEGDRGAAREAVFRARADRRTVDWFTPGVGAADRSSTVPAPFIRIAPASRRHGPGVCYNLRA